MFCLRACFLTFPRWPAFHCVGRETAFLRGLDSLHSPRTLLNTSRTPFSHCGHTVQLQLGLCKKGVLDSVDETAMRRIMSPNQLRPAVRGRKTFRGIPHSEPEISLQRKRVSAPRQEMLREILLQSQAWLLSGQCMYQT